MESNRRHAWNQNVGKHRPARTPKNYEAFDNLGRRPGWIERWHYGRTYGFVKDEAGMEAFFTWLAFSHEWDDEDNKPCCRNALVDTNAFVNDRVTYELVKEINGDGRPEAVRIRGYQKDFKRQWICRQHRT